MGQRRKRIKGSRVIYRTDSMMATLVDAGLRHWDGRWLYLRTLKTALYAASAVAVITLAPLAIGNPSNPTVVSGSATINTPSSNVLQVDQSTKIVIINWKSFNIAPGQTTLFSQPSADSTAINRIGSNSPSVILGNLLANGRIILINGNGILFGPNATVNVGALVATTSDASDADLAAGNLNFNKPGNPNAQIINQGSITANSGLVGLVAPAVRNDGTIAARLGSVTLGASNIFTVDFTGDGLISFPVNANIVTAAIDASGKPVEALVVNNGKIEGSTVVMSARAARDLVTNVVSMGGTIAANTVSQNGGTVVLDGGDGNVSVTGKIAATGNVGGSVTVQGNGISLSGAQINASGTDGGGHVSIGGATTQNLTADSTTRISASAIQTGNGGQVQVLAQNTQFAGSIDARGGAQGGNGGSVETSGSQQLDAVGALVDTTAPHGATGNWLLDPPDLTVDAAAAATIAGDLQTTNVTLQTTASTTSGPGNVNASGNGDIYIDSSIAWTENTTLTLDAYHSVIVNAPITIGGTGGGLTIVTNDGGSGGTLSFPAGSASFTAGSGGNLSINGASYTLLYTMSDVAGINGSGGNYALANSIDASTAGTYSAAVVSTFSGNLEGLGNTISNLTISAPSTNYIALIGTLESGATVSDIGLINANMSGYDYTAGLVGWNGGSILRSYTTGSVSGNSGVGGLVGLNTGTGTISQSYATASVSGSSNVGGLVGANFDAITQSYATGSVSGADYVGGLVGYDNGAMISQSYATGSVTGSQYVGGLVGDSLDTITYSYATGSVSGTDYVGGLVGQNDGTIAQTYASGSVTGSGIDIGGLVGNNTVTNGITQSYWDTSTSGQANGVGAGDTNGVAGLTTAQSMDASNFVGWNFGTSPTGSSNDCSSACWVIVDQDSTLNNASGAAGGTRPFLLSEYSTGITNAHQLQLMELDPTAYYTLANDIDLGTPLANASSNWGSAGFIPIGNSSTPFTGTFDGQNHTISGLAINLPNNADVGLFGYLSPVSVSSGMVENVALSGGSVSGDNYVGELVGFNDGGTISNASSTGTVSAADEEVGGLVGLNLGTVSSSFSTGAVSGYEFVGGLVGANNGSVVDSYSTGNITGSYEVGGLIGENGGMLSNAFYDTDQVLINGTHILTVGGLYDSQYQDWFNHGLSLNIANYFGSPDANGYYSISSLTDLQNLLGFAETPGLMFKLTNNIDLSTQPGFYIPYFAGTLNGQGYAINNIDLSLGFDDAVGFVGLLTPGASLTNIGVVGGTIEGNQLVGGLVGVNLGSISQSYATSSVTGNPYTGGLVGFNEGGSISQSYATGSVDGTFYVGGLVGFNAYGASISQSYATGAVNGYAYAGGLVGYNYYSSISESYATGSVSANDYVGGLVGLNDSTSTITQTYASGQVTSGGANVGGLVGINTVTGGITESYWDNQTSGQANGVGTGDSSGVTGLSTAQTMDSSNFVGWNFGTSPTGSSNDCSAACWVLVDQDGTLNNAGGATGGTRPFLLSEYSTTINNAHQLQLMELDPTASYTLANDIDLGTPLSDASSNWGAGGFIPIGNSFTPFTGTFDGAGHTISGLTIDLPNRDFVGLFGYVASSGVVENVQLSGGSVTGDYSVGDLAGENDGTITSSSATGSVAGTAFYVGGLAGYNEGTIQSSYSTGNVTGTYYVGGLAGENVGTLSNSFYDSDQVLINGAHLLTAGALYDSQYQDWITHGLSLNIANYLAGPDVNGYYSITDLADLENVLGFVETPGLKFKLTNDIDLSAQPGFYIPYFAAAAFDGQNHTISNISVSLPFDDFVGFIGYLSPGSSVTNIGIAGGTVSGADYVGGLVGLNNQGSISQSYATTTVNGNFFFAGGLVGASEQGSISQSYATGSVTGGYNYVGGLVGYNASGSISQSYATGSASSSSGIDVGGLVGWNNSGSITQSYATGATSGLDYVGGLAGENDGTISQAYASGPVTSAGSNVGGLVGFNSVPGGITVSYWDMQNTGENVGVGTGDPSGVTGLTTAQLAGGSLPTGFDPTVWTAQVHNYPCLQWQAACVGAIIPLTYSVADVSSTYGTLATLGAAALSGLLPGDSGGVTGVVTAFDSGNNPVTLSTSTNAGTYSEQVTLLTGPDAAYYKIATAGNTNGALTIDPKSLTVDASPETKIYGQSDPTLAYSASGFVNGDSASTILAGSLTRTSGETVAGGPYAITQGTLATTSANYTIDYAGANLTITPAVLTVTADPESKVYGSADPTLAFSASGFKFSDTTSSVLSGALTRVAGESVAGGPYAINQGSLTANANYTIDYAGNALAITPAPLSVIANNATRLVNEPNPVLSATVVGLKLGDTASVISGLSISTTAVLDSPAGAYPIATSGGTAANYVIVSRANGVLTILLVSTQALDEFLQQGDDTSTHNSQSLSTPGSSQNGGGNNTNNGTLPNTVPDIGNGLAPGSIICALSGISVPCVQTAALH